MNYVATCGACDDVVCFVDATGAGDSSCAEGLLLSQQNHGRGWPRKRGEAPLLLDLCGELPRVAARWVSRS